jgi:hypothetical protein
LDIDGQSGYPARHHRVVASSSTSMPKPGGKKRGLGSLQRVPARLFSNEFLIGAGFLAVERWNRLTPEQQDRFRELAAKAEGDSKANLTAPERKELRRIWRALEVRGLIREVLGRAAAGS